MKKNYEKPAIEKRARLEKVSASSKKEGPVVVSGIYLRDFLTD